MPYADQSETYARVLHYSAAGFAALFVIEILLRVLAIGCGEFLSDGERMRREGVP